MTVGAGVLRSASSLAETAATVEDLATQLDDGDDGRVRWEARNLVDVSRGVLAAATERHESRGAHTRTDFPELDAGSRLRLVLAAPG
jgi:L-aspartate oxidase